jgi:hypothetical protein
VKDYEDRFANPFVAAERGFIDEVIMPHSTRRRICRAFASLRMQEAEQSVEEARQHPAVSDPRGAAMLKHRGFPGRLAGHRLPVHHPSGQRQVPVRRRLSRESASADRRPQADPAAADAAFMAALWQQFGAGTVRARQSRCGTAFLALSGAKSCRPKSPLIHERL